jgi:2-polyprenyl-3-methyl-5-hydroxy-6-metoxy-1,4-benzoquinol methylase
VPSLGLTSGWQCLELGAGAGSIACWLAARVGPSGQVVATDIDPRFLQDLKLPNLEVRRHDIRTDALEREAYDLVHCRNLLVHLPDPEQMARRMVAALRPGG